MMNLEEGIRFLAAGGLNLVSVLDVHELPDQTKHLIAGSGVPLTDYRRLVLIGHGGRRMWEKLQEGEMMPSDPVDRYSQALTGRFIRDCLDDSPVLWLYPGTRYLVPLQQMGEAAGWSFPSPLGTGISPVYGVWFAYRAAFLTDAELAPTREAAAPPPVMPALPSSASRLVRQVRFERTPSIPTDVRDTGSVSDLRASTAVLHAWPAPSSRSTATASRKSNTITAIRWKRSVLGTTRSAQLLDPFHLEPGNYHDRKIKCLLQCIGQA